MNKFHVCISFALVTLLAKLCASRDNGLALTPPMGWMNNVENLCVVDCEENPDTCTSEKYFKKVADLLVSEGYKDVGYEYVVIDDCWSEKKRSPDGTLLTNKKRFPNGMKHLADYIHSKGLKLGLYVNYANETSHGYPGILGHLKQDAARFAEFGIDYLKVDAYTTDLKSMVEGYVEFSQYVNGTGRPMVYECSWPFYSNSVNVTVNYTLVMEHCNLWRQDNNIDNRYSRFTEIMDNFADHQDIWQQYAGPGHWNDPDSLIIGNNGLNVETSTAQMVAWAMLAAPLMMSTDLNMQPEFKQILQNKEIIAVNQDVLGIQGKRILRDNGIDVWTRPLQPRMRGHSPYAVAFISRRNDSTPYTLKTTLRSLGLPDISMAFGYQISELSASGLNSRTPFILQTTDDTWNVQINAKGAVLFKAEALDIQCTCQWPPFQ